VQSGFFNYQNRSNSWTSTSSFAKNLPRGWIFSPKRGHQKRAAGLKPTAQVFDGVVECYGHAESEYPGPETSTLNQDLGTGLAR
jgi:hypothetical protein